MEGFSQFRDTTSQHGDTTSNASSSWKKRTWHKRHQSSELHGLTTENITGGHFVSGLLLEDMQLSDEASSDGEFGDLQIKRTKTVTDKKSVEKQRSDIKGELKELDKSLNGKSGSLSFRVKVVQRSGVGSK